MATHNYVKLQNQGSIISNLRLLAEMVNAKNEYADRNGYFTKRAIAQIAASALLITSGSIIGQELESLWNNTEIEEGRNSLLQNAKQRMQILRSLGLVSTDYNAEMYAVTELAEMVLQETFGKKHSKKLLRELFMCISPNSEVYEYNCPMGFDCYLGYQICYAFANLDHKISTDEMPCITTYSIHDIKEFVEDARRFRDLGVPFPADHPHRPRRQNGEILQQQNNITRTLNQILRECGIIEAREQNRYYVCTPDGKTYVDNINRRFDALKFLTPYKFRKLNLIEQKSRCKEGLDNIYHRAEIIIPGEETDLVFSPYQLIPETCVQWLFEQTPRKPPVAHEGRINVINSEITTARLRLHASFDYNVSAIIQNNKNNKLLDEMLSAKKEGIAKESFADTLIARYKPTNHNVFYPFIHSLLNILGLECKGGVSRIDGYALYNEHVIPVEIKSFTEIPCYNMKGLRQAIENKIITYRADVPDDLNYSSLVVGFNHPDNDSDFFTFIDNAKEKLGIKIVTCDTPSLVYMAVRIVWDNLVLNLDDIFTQYGMLNENSLCE